MSEKESIKIYISGLEKSEDGFFADDLNKLISTLSKEGIYCYIPSYPFYMDESTFAEDLKKIERCYAVLLIGGKSDKLKAEYLRTQEIGVPVFRDTKKLISHIDACKCNPDIL